MITSECRGKERIANERRMGLIRSKERIEARSYADVREQTKHTEGLLMGNPKPKMNKSENAEHHKAGGYR